MRNGVVLCLMDKQFPHNFSWKAGMYKVVLRTIYRRAQQKSMTERDGQTNREMQGEKHLH